MQKRTNLVAYVTRYKGYQLHCTPEELVNGRFAARLMCRSPGPDGKVIAVALTSGSFESKRKAAVYACDQGKEWVDRHT